MVFNKLINLLKKKKIKNKVSRIKKTKKNKIIKGYKQIKIKKKKQTPKKKINKKEKLVASATHYFSKIKVAVLKLKDTLKINDKIRIKGFTTDFVQNVTSMQIDHNPVKEAKKGQEIGILVKGKVRHKDKVYKI